MGQTILRVLDDAQLSPALSSKLQELLPGYTLQRFNEKPDYRASIRARVEILHEAFSLILEANPVNPAFTYLTKETLKAFADEAKAKCDFTKLDLDDLHKELEQFTGNLVSAIRVAWPWDENPKLNTKKAIACLNEAEQYLLMSKGRPNIATLTPMDFGSGPEFVLQIDEALPAYYPQLLEELRVLKTKAFPKTPAWFTNLKAEEQAYLCNLSISTISAEELVADLQNLIDSLAHARKHALNWSSDLGKINNNELPLPDWYNKLTLPKREMVKVLCGKSVEIEGAVTVFKTFISEKTSNASFKSELAQVISLPQWYSLLPKLQQNLLKYIVNAAVKLEDVVFFLPSRNRMLPAPANFGAHRLLRIDKDGLYQELADKRRRSSHVSSRDLIKAKAPMAVRRRHTLSNLDQVFRYATKDQELLAQTLISPLDLGDYVTALLSAILPELPPDKELYEELREVLFTSKYALKVHQTNHPFNLAKRIFYTEADDDDSLRLIQDTKESLARIDELQEQISSIEEEIALLNAEKSDAKTTTPEAILLAKKRGSALKENLPVFYAKKEEVAELLEDYIHVLNSSIGSATVFDYQGRELFLSSIEQLIILAKGGYCYGSCVSGKDRKALELIHTDAMIIYKTRYGTWPTFTDGEFARKNFVNIVVNLYLSRHQHELAGQNAPGSTGIKTPEWYFPKDICVAINAKLGTRGLEHDDRLATDNEVKNIFTNLTESLIPESLIKAALIAKQIGEVTCTELYSALFKLIDQPKLFEVPTTTKIVRSIFSKNYSVLPEGIRKIRDFMHNTPGEINVPRIEEIINIVHTRPAADEDRTEATNLVYDGILGLCQIMPKLSLQDYIASIISSWTERFNAAVKEKVNKSSPVSSDDEVSSPVM